MYIFSIVAGFVGEGLGFTSREYLVWYVLFIVFVPYAMLPLPLRWCMAAGCVSALSHIAVTSAAKFHGREDDLVKIYSK